MAGVPGKIVERQLAHYKKVTRTTRLACAPRSARRRRPKQPNKRGGAERQNEDEAAGGLPGRSYFAVERPIRPPCGIGEARKPRRVL
jgi:hypothetical protein